MSFITDKQTIDDLNIFSKSGSDSIYHIFNKTYTQGGASLLEELFRNPLSNAAAINERVAILGYFQQSKISFPLQGNRFEEAERYLSNTDPRSRLSNQGFSMADFKTAGQSVTALIEILQGLKTFLLEIQSKVAGNPYGKQVTLTLDLLHAKELELVFADHGKGKISSGKIVEYDNILRFQQRSLMEKILQQIYHLDVYISIARVATEHGYTFAHALPRDANRLRLMEVYHPLLHKPVPNSLEMTPDSNIVFLTGANMGGKSTFMKSLSIAMYLAHLGFPIAAKQMEFSVCDGMYTTINLPDNLSMGASHFYAEVLRVKKVATELGAGKNLFVVFDELFRGTNVKDAYEGTIAIMEAFARKPHSLFVISTHIMEAGAVLKERCGNMIFRYLPTTMYDGKPVYSYTLTEGITDDRHGMIIINNEGVIELIKNKKQAKQQHPDFLADKQTGDDLNLQGKFKQQSIYSLFNHLQTRGGEKVLEGMFARPLNHAEKINTRAALFAFFQRHKVIFPVIRSQVESMEDYLAGGAGASLPRVAWSIFAKKFKQTLFHSAELLQLQAGQSVTIEVLQAFREFFADLKDKNGVDVYQSDLDTAQRTMQDSRLQEILNAPEAQLSMMQLIRNDYIIRHAMINEMETLLKLIYELDVFVGVAAVAADQGFVYAKALPPEGMLLDVEGFRHPALKNGVANNLHLTRERNMLFLTGANMAGKSTFMKSLGIAVYLAHMGFPIAAKRMEFSVKDGLFSSINVSDNLDMGYSHFYAEVLRTKTVAQSVSESQDLYVLFDELFKGTNVKDAYDATLAVCKAFAENRNSFFVVSTHIIEVGEALGEACDNLQFSFLPTVMKDGVPTYPYTLESGITTDRQGMIIIENEKIIELIQANDPQSPNLIQN
ncbi:putative mismatch repair-like protein [Pedobacter sp. BAL39]|uniref:MutS-related protein n=1 Tax=Pedobacter sp. BAL39 TaxID=391596 RepID=UPI0001559E7B|nr:putative mismatch repair-like protein [Pedobacter sp. BAL39]EDM34888.1 putative mismatch repair-like protein [Pedobacter sp. BAL39]